MKQVLQDMRSGVTSVEDVPIPTIRPGTVLVQTATSLVSAGTERMLVEFAGKSLVGKARSRPDLMRQVVDKARREGLLTTFESAINRLDQPMALGYSSAGKIVEVGDNLRGYQVGQRVACAGGGYAVHAEYAIVPQNLVALLPEEVDYESAAFTTLGAIALHGFRLSQAVLGEGVAVIGLGLVGLLAAQIAQAGGCRVMGIDLDPARVKLGVDLGFHAVNRTQAIESGQGFTSGNGFDAVIICADTPTSDPVELAGILARQRARVVAVGAVGQQLPRKIYYEKELFFVNSRSYGPGRYDPEYEEKGIDYPIGYVRWTEKRNMQAFIDLLRIGAVKVEPLVSHRFPIEQASQAYRLIMGENQETFLGVLLQYHGEGKVSNERASRRIVNRQATGGKRNAAKETKAKLGLGVIGAGNFATTIILPTLSKLVQIEPIGIASASGVNAQHAARRFGFAYATSQAEQILEDPHIDILAILTPHNLHAAQVLAGLQAGKHVFCEKPLAITAEELQEIEEFLKQLENAGAGGKEMEAPPPLLMVGFNRRFAPLMRQLASFLAGRSEPLYGHYRINAGYLPLTHWLHDSVLGGGRIVGEGCHFIDALTYLVGTPPSRVFANSLPDSGNYSEDNVSLTFSFPDGSMGSLAYLANGDKSFPKEYLEVFCGGKVAVLDDFRSLKLVHAGKSKLLRSHFKQDKGHRLELQAFIRAIQLNMSAPIPYTHLLAVSRASLKALQALRSGKSVDI
jgi:predicted dehydrogenase